MNARPANDCPPTVGAVEGHSIALGASAGAAYRGNGAADKGAVPAREALDVHRPGFDARPVWELAKRDGVLVAGEREYKDARYFELRLWAGDGDKPTAKGVTLPCDAVRSLAEAMMAYADRRAASALHSGS